MRNALLLFRHWDDADGYTEAILKEFDWMREEQKILGKLISKERLGNEDGRMLWMNARKRGVKISVTQASVLMKRLSDAEAPKTVHGLWPFRKDAQG